MKMAELKEDYSARLPIIRRFAKSVRTQLVELLSTHSITLGVPLESRVKSWNSIEEKIERNSLQLGNIGQLSDLVGMRLAFLFKRDLDKACSLLGDTLNIVSEEDTGERLGDARFGYQSLHYIVKIPGQWLSLPSFVGCSDLFIEVQLRTLAQHIWAAASHKLQYKQESSVPLPVRRSIHRVSALLETVDLEFERVLQERESYISDPSTDQAEALLNVDILSKLIDASLPKKNRVSDEPYAELLTDLDRVGIVTALQIQELITKHLAKALFEDVRIVQTRVRERTTIGTTQERINKGVYYSHVGLMRRMLKFEFGVAGASFNQAD